MKVSSTTLTALDGARRSLPRWHLKFRDLSILIPVLLGVVAFFYITGGKILKPTAVQWLFLGDWGTHFLGWHYFRTEPFFQLPFGMIRNYGEQIGSSIVYTDSVPLFAFLFRPFGAVLPHYFQYFGLWLLFCFCMQAVFAWKLFETLEMGWLPRVLICGFFVFAPAFVWRILAIAGAGHWVLLAAIWLLLSDSKLGWRWTLLLGLTSLVHVYLLFMVLAIWSGNILKRLLGKEVSLGTVFLHLTVTTVLLLGTMWFAGYFSLQGGQEIGGYGAFRMNLVSLINPLSGWSHIFAVQPTTPQEAEGFNYLGLGMFLLGVLALGALAQSSKLRLNWRTVLPFMFIVVVLTAIAISNRIAWGNTELFSYPLVFPFSKFAAIFRASGRMFWPVYYLMMIGIFWVLCRSFSRTALTILLGLCFIIQITDSGVALNQMKREFPAEARWNSPLKSDFWETAAKVYKHVIYVLPDNNPPGYFPLALYAADHGMAINVGYFARVDDLIRNQVRKQLATEIFEGEFSRDALYIFQNGPLWDVALERLRDSDGAAVIDGFRVVAPQWAVLNPDHTAPMVIGNAARVTFKSTDTPTSTLSFATGQPGEASLISGWSESEEWGTWTVAKTAVLLVRVPAPISADQVMKIDGRVFLARAKRNEEVAIYVNNQPAGDWFFRLGESTPQIEFKIPKSLVNDSAGRLLIEFHISHPVSPVILNLYDDPRPLGFGLEKLQILPD